MKILCFLLSFGICRENRALSDLLELGGDILGIGNSGQINLVNGNNGVIQSGHNITRFDYK